MIDWTGHMTSLERRLTQLIVMSVISIIFSNTSQKVYIINTAIAISQSGDYHT